MIIELILLKLQTARDGTCWIRCVSCLACMNQVATSSFSSAVESQKLFAYSRESSGISSFNPEEDIFIWSDKSHLNFHLGTQTTRGIKEGELSHSSWRITAASAWRRPMYIHELNWVTSQVTNACFMLTRRKVKIWQIVPLRRSGLIGTDLKVQTCSHMRHLTGRSMLMRASGYSTDQCGNLMQFQTFGK